MLALSALDEAPLGGWHDQAGNPLAWGREMDEVDSFPSNRFLRKTVRTRTDFPWSQRPLDLL